MLHDIAADVRLLDNLRATRVVYAPHRRWQAGDYDNWDHPNPTQRLVRQRHTFARGTWGGEWHPDFVPQEGDIIVQEHWGQSGFANTDLDFQLKQQGITHVIVVACWRIHVLSPRAASQWNWAITSRSCETQRPLLPGK